MIQRFAAGSFIYGVLVYYFVSIGRTIDGPHIISLHCLGSGKGIGFGTMFEDVDYFDLGLTVDLFVSITFS